jgi:hypothetical protein
MLTEKSIMKDGYQTRLKVPAVYPKNDSEAVLVQHCPENFWHKLFPKLVVPPGDCKVIES